MLIIQVMPSVKKSSEDLTDSDSKPVAPPRVKGERPDRLASATERSNNTNNRGSQQTRPNTAHTTQYVTEQKNNG